MDPNPWVALGQTIGELFVVLGQLVVVLVAIAANWLLLIVWVAWWLGAVNWRKAWPVLGYGGWAPLVLLAIIVPLAWFALQPGPWEWTGVMTIPGFWWQLLFVWGLVLLALFCGWLQGVFGWTPPEINLQPPAHGDGHAHAAHH